MSIPKILQVLFLPVTISQDSNSSCNGVGEYKTCWTPPHSSLGALTLCSGWWCFSSTKVEETFGCLVVSKVSKLRVLVTIVRNSNAVKAT